MYLIRKNYPSSYSDTSPIETKAATTAQSHQAMCVSGVTSL